MLRPATLRLLALLAPVSAGCSVFDPALYMNRDVAGTDAADAQPNNDVPDSSPPVMIADRCQTGVPVMLSNATPFAVDTSTLRNDFSQLADCLPGNTPGIDGFFAVDMTQGERWHFHVRAVSANADPAVYILPSCDERSCVPGAGLDECGAGRDEHISFVAPSTARYIVGVDSRSEGASVQYEVIALRPTCGNMMTEHSETCDDGDTESGDGCSSTCQAELRGASAREAEPNDDAAGSNMIDFGAETGSLSLRGRIGGRCDFDMFRVVVPANGSVTGALTETGAACTAGAPPLRLSLVDPDGRTVLATVAGDAANPCPTLTRAGLALGVYYLRMTTVAADAASFDYQLGIEVSVP